MGCSSGQAVDVDSVRRTTGRMLRNLCSLAFLVVHRREASSIK